MTTAEHLADLERREAELIRACNDGPDLGSEGNTELLDEIAALQFVMLQLHQRRTLEGV